MGSCTATSVGLVSEYEEYPLRTNCSTRLPFLSWSRSKKLNQKDGSVTRAPACLAWSQPFSFSTRSGVALVR